MSSPVTDLFHMLIYFSFDPGGAPRFPALFDPAFVLALKINNGAQGGSPSAPLCLYSYRFTGVGVGRTPTPGYSLAYWIITCLLVVLLLLLGLLSLPLCGP